MNITKLTFDDNIGHNVSVGDTVHYCAVSTLGGFSSQLDEANACTISCNNSVGTVKPSGNVFANGGAGTPGSVPEGADVASNDTIANQTVSDPLLIYSDGEYTHPETSVCTAFNFTSGECGD